VRLEQAGQLSRRDRPAKEVALRLVTIVLAQEFKIFSRLNAVSDDSQIQASTHADD